MPKPVIGVVGPCAAGKSTLIRGLRLHGYEPRHIAQEHSYVKDMWQRLVNPDALIYLHVAFPHTLKRRNLNWTEAEYAEQLRRLAHARQHADILIDTSELTPEEVLRAALHGIETQPKRREDD